MISNSRIVVARLFTSVVKTGQNTFFNKMSTDFTTKGKKIIGAAVNYKDVVKARNIQTPTEPVVFMKPTTSYIKEGQDIIIPKGFTKVAHEVELGVIIKDECKNVSKEEAMKYVGGYCLALDMTAQCELGVARQKGNPWLIGKGFDTSTPVSRFIPLNQIKDPDNVKLWLTVNDEKRQIGNTCDLIFDIPYLIEYISHYITLEPNDLILTGTPDGAAPIKCGDIIKCGLNDISMSFAVKSE